MRRYNVVTLDPPWPTIPRAGVMFARHGGDRSIGFDRMGLDGIRAIPVPDLLRKDAHVFLWCVQRFLPEAFDILRAWGLRFRILVTWDKGRGMSLFGWYRRSEFVLYASSGKIGPMCARGKTIHTVFSVPPERPMATKPDFFYDEITRRYAGPRLDMFARKKRKGWDVFGDEVDGSIEIPGFPGSESR